MLVVFLTSPLGQRRPRQPGQFIRHREAEPWMRWPALSYDFDSAMCVCDASTRRRLCSAPKAPSPQLPLVNRSNESRQKTNLAQVLHQMGREPISLWCTEEKKCVVVSSKKMLFFPSYETIHIISLRGLRLRCQHFFSFLLYLFCLNF